jgi:hypothetical protein
MAAELDDISFKTQPLTHKTGIDFYFDTIPDVISYGRMPRIRKKSKFFTYDEESGNYCELEGGYRGGDQSEDGIYSYKKCKELGRGDYGHAYLADISKPAKRKLVLKEILFEDPSSTPEMFDRETAIGEELGEIGKAPKIYAKWKTSDKGYYLMDLLSSDWKHIYGDSLKGKDSERHQSEFMEAITEMVTSGYLHQDCHKGNVGFVKNGVDDKVVLFDFGLTVQFDSENLDVNEIFLLTISQFYILIEQMVISDKFSDENLINTAINDVWGMVESKYNFPPYSAKTRSKYTISDQSDHIHQCMVIISKNLADGNPFAQINILMAYLYKLLDIRYILNGIADPIEDFESYTENAFGCMIYDLIYEIRKNKFSSFVDVDTWIYDYTEKSKPKKKPSSPYFEKAEAITIPKVPPKVSINKPAVVATVGRVTRSRTSKPDVGGKTRRRKHRTRRRKRSRRTRRF